MRRLLAFIPIALLLWSCSKPPVSVALAPAVSVALTSAEAQALAESFARLDKVLAANAAVIHTNLAPPATEADIAVLRAALNGATNFVLEAWFGWHNGALNLGTSLLPLGLPQSIAEALEDRKLIQSIPFIDKLRKRSLKILEDIAGDGFFVDVTSLKPRVFYHMLEDGTPRYYGTLTEFVNFIATGFESGVLSVDAKGQFNYDNQKYQVFEQEHFRAIGQQR
jgi:hypothetical protein